MVNYRRVWEKEYGEIKEGYEIHHIDHNRENNNIENLVCLEKNIHKDYHKKHSKTLPNDYCSIFNNNERTTRAIEYNISSLLNYVSFLEDKHEIIAIKESIDRHTQTI